MPKERRDRSLSLERSRLSPYPCNSSCSRQSSINPLEDDKNIKDWEEARCPVCMEHPHNAILLICSSHEKGCRPFMCDTSYRHSNCFDQFQKSFTDTPAETLSSQDVQDLLSPSLSAPPLSETVVSELEGEINLDESVAAAVAEPSEKPAAPKLVCPLCRGEINGWTVVGSARHFMNAKARSCASETCDFSGTYKDLRKHARAIHPLVRPTDTDPERQDNWRRLERQRDLGDLLSTLQSTIGEERTGESTLTVDEGGWLTVFFLVRFIRPGTSSTRSSTPRTRAQIAVRRSLRRLWGENIDREAETTIEEENGSFSDSGVSTPRRYVRRRFRNQENNE